MLDNELLARIDERCSNIYKLQEKQEQHLAKLNDALDNHELRLALLEKSQPNKRYLMAALIAILTVLGGFIAALLKR